MGPQLTSNECVFCCVDQNLQLHMRTVTVSEAAGQEVEPMARAAVVAQVTLEGPDTPGLVFRVAELLAAHGLKI